MELRFLSACGSVRNSGRKSRSPDAARTLFPESARVFTDVIVVLARDMPDAPATTNAATAATPTASHSLIVRLLTAVPHEPTHRAGRDLEPETIARRGLERDTSTVLLARLTYNLGHVSGVSRCSSAQLRSHASSAPPVSPMTTRKTLGVAEGHVVRGGDARNVTVTTQ